MSQNEEEDFDLPHMEDDHHGGDHDEPWLVSYADLMTLLFGFFVLMYSFAAAKNNQEGTITMRAELAQFFGGTYINPLEGTGEKFKEAIANSPGLSEGLKESLKDLIIKVTPEGLEVTFSSTALFKSGAAVLETDAKTVLNEFIKVISDNKEEYQVTVEGYTDATPMSSDRFPSNWELSASRATTVVRMFETNGFNPDTLKAIGFGATRPLVPNFDVNGEYISQNLAKNRRVVIYVRRVLEE